MGTDPNADHLWRASAGDDVTRAQHAVQECLTRLRTTRNELERTAVQLAAAVSARALTPADDTLIVFHADWPAARGDEHALATEQGPSLRLVEIAHATGSAVIDPAVSPALDWADAVAAWDALRSAAVEQYSFSLPGLILDIDAGSVAWFEPYYCPEAARESMAGAGCVFVSLTEEPDVDEVDELDRFLQADMREELAEQAGRRIEGLLGRYRMEVPSLPEHAPGACPADLALPYDMSPAPTPAVEPVRNPGNGASQDQQPTSTTGAADRPWEDLERALSEDEVTVEQLATLLAATDGVVQDPPASSPGRSAGQGRQRDNGGHDRRGFYARGYGRGWVDGWAHGRNQGYQKALEDLAP